MPVISSSDQRSRPEITNENTGLRLINLQKHLPTQKFFIPFTTDPEQAQLVCQWVETRLKRTGYSLIKEPVFQVTFQQGSQLITDTVGQKSACTGEMVMLILRNDLEFLICSYSQGFVRGEPVRIPVSQVKAATGFGEGV